MLNHRGHREKPQAIDNMSSGHRRAETKTFTSLGTLREGQVLETIL
jgi:hypothetical protein